jgi:alcohol dehydrogenase class IV
MANIVNINIPRTVMGQGAVNCIGEIVREFSPAKVLIVTDEGVTKAGLLNSITAVLEKDGHIFDLFAGCQPEAPLSIVEELTQKIRAEKYDLLIGLGGGSTMDTTKIASILATGSLSISELMEFKLAKMVVTKILIPTTAGTGSEWSNVAVVTDDINVQPSQTRIIVSPQNFANAVIVDPETTLNLPKKVTADSGIDALIHAIEAYTSPLANTMSDMFAETAIKLVSGNLRRAYAQGNKDIQSRVNMATAASLAMYAVVLSSIGLAHMMNVPLGKKAGILHGSACYILLPTVMEFNMVSNPAKYARVATLMGENIDGLSVPEAAAKSVEAVVKIATDLSMPQKSDVKISDADIEAMVDELYQFQGPIINIQNPRQVTREDVKRLYLDVLRGQPRTSH